MRQSAYKPPKKDRAALIFLIVASLALLLLSGCRTRYKTVPIQKIEYRDRYHTRTVLDTVKQSDTLIVKDSVIVRQKGDSTLIERLRYELRILNYRNKQLQHDTLYRRDSVYVEKPVEVVVERPTLPPRARWQIGGFWLLILALSVYVFIRFRLRKF